ncbi:MAG: sugar ABC transporter ATP-binding protein [Rhodospirillales bacterium]|nr:sugar ABC transporter ATP-binding protein [Rhodospirillales bacterium]
MSQTVQPLLQVNHLRKNFGAIEAVKDVSFDIEPAEIVAIVGDNGAGKSTVAKMIAGAYRRDGGEMLWNSTPYDPTQPDDARAIGIETMYQDLALVNDLDAAGNIFLNREPMRRIFGVLPVLDRGQMRSRSADILRRVKIELPSYDRPVRQLSGGQRQAAALGRILLSDRARLIIMDEPTAALGVQEQRKVLDLISSLGEAGIAIMIISHNLEHVFSVSRRIVVLRGGRLAGVVKTAEVDRQHVVSLIVGGGA